MGGRVRIVERLWSEAVFRLVRALRWFLRASGRGAGGTLPGRIALVLHRGALRTLTRDRFVVLVSGTNGKSTTTALLTAALGWRGPVVSNADGSNLPRGLVSTLLVAPGAIELAVLEVDEMLLRPVMDQTRPEVLVLLNLSRDQLDRVEEVSSHVHRWSQALSHHPDTWVVANADDPLVVAAVTRDGPRASRTVWVAAGCPWRGDVTLCPVCGTHWEPAREPWRCANCGFSRPTPQWSVTGNDLVGTDGTTVPLEVSIPGRSGISNAGMAVVAAHVASVPLHAAAARLPSVRDVDGRYQRFTLPSGQVRLLLGKNPAGWLEVLDDIMAGDGTVLIGINAQVADGIDPSWLWDVNFERLRGRQVVVFGDRRLDLSVRLTYGEVPHDLAADLDEALRLPVWPLCSVAANYTAFVQARNELRVRAEL